jgi:hypothetical protein
LTSLRSLRSLTLITGDESGSRFALRHRLDRVPAPLGEDVLPASRVVPLALNGNVLETDVWIASELVGFDSYGVAPSGLRQNGAVLGRQPIGPKGFPKPSGPMPTGGLAVFRIRLLPISGSANTAILQLNCALGKVPAERQMEGIRLCLERNGTEFSEEVSGRVIFLSLRPEGMGPTKTPQQEPAPDVSEPPNS